MQSSGDLLQHIQQLQFTDKGKAEHLLVEFLADTFPLEIVSVELRPQVISLNSFNGFMRLRDGRQLFFKTHTESDTVISEYYQASMLADAGYPILQPLYSSTEVGRQILIYEVITAPSVFDVAWESEIGEGGDVPAELAAAQTASDKLLMEIYRQTLEVVTAEQNERAPIHQLFFHRITGGRFTRFYGSLDQPAADSPVIGLPCGSFALPQIRAMHWSINGQQYNESIDDIAKRAKHQLHPHQQQITVIGHGDAHNGNVFLLNRESSPKLMYFDPAFAGRHSPLLDIVKPLFHNVFAMWMYFPQIKANSTKLTTSVSKDSNVISVEHDYVLHPVRHMFLESKVQNVLIPLIIELKRRNALPNDWRSYLKSGLYCCPLLTMNLADEKRFPPVIGALGLTMAVEMGSESLGNRSHLDTVLDEVERAT